MNIRIFSALFLIYSFIVSGHSYAETTAQADRASTATPTTPSPAPTIKIMPTESTPAITPPALSPAPETSITPPARQQDVVPPSQLEVQYQNEKNLFLPRFRNYIALDRPTYVLPFYYTGFPDYSIYNQIDPGRPLDKTEFKTQISLYLPIVKNLFYNKNVSINLSYTQLFYWQLYNSSPYFRETNYEPEIALKFRIVRNIFGQLAIDHQSNGRGGTFERSWNRIIGTFEFSTTNLFLQINGWFLIFTNNSSDIHNPHIAWFLGYDKIILSYRLWDIIWSVEANNIESLYTRGYYIVTASRPLTQKVSLYLQYFGGYGQSLIEYNHKTQSFGVGLSLNDWQ